MPGTWILQPHSGAFKFRRTPGSRIVSHRALFPHPPPSFRSLTDSADAGVRINDRELQERLRRGDHSAFDVIFRAHYAALVGLAERMVREREAAEEVVQDVFVEVWRRRETLAIEETMRAYLYRATRNRALNRIRHEQVRQKNQHKVEADASVEPALRRVEEREIDQAVREAVSNLPDRCREVFELSRGSGLKYAEIAEVMGISVKTVEAQMGKALRVLREQLASWLEAPPSG